MDDARGERRAFLVFSGAVALLIVAPGLLTEPAASLIALLLLWPPYLLCSAACFVWCRRAVVRWAFGIGASYLAVAFGFWLHGPLMLGLPGLSYAFSIAALALLVATCLARLLLASVARWRARHV